MPKPVLVIKLGSAVITGQDGQLNEKLIQKIAAGVADLRASFHVVLVSSGAVSSGKGYLKNYKGTLLERKAAASIGNPLLMQTYHGYFSALGITVAQALCERHHFSNRAQFLQLKETFFELWKNDIVPIVNENDLVSNIELKFSDNDELATLLAIGFDAEALLLCTSVGGFLDDSKKIIPVIPAIDQQVLSLIREDKSAVGLGGMVSKITFTRLATSLGIRVIIAGLSGEHPFADALAGKSGTSFLPRPSNLTARQKWLASGSITPGSIHVDKGAEQALLDRKSLLTVGIKDVAGNFSAGEVAQIVNEDNKIIAVAKLKLGIADIRAKIAARNIIAAHADDIVLL